MIAARDFREFCHGVIPGMLHKACGVEASLANAIGADIFRRAEAFAALDIIAQGLLAAPFVEDVVDFEPMDVSIRLKAATAVVVRNSLLEQAHACGPVNAGGIEAITTSGARALSEFLEIDRHQSSASSGENLFGSLSAKFPRAWAALSALSIAVSSGGGRVSCMKVDAPAPKWPEAREVVSARRSEHNAEVVVRSGIEAVMDDQLLERLRAVTDSKDYVFFLPSLSRVSRNLDVLLYALELLLANGGQILTTNYLMRTNEVWVRRGRLLAASAERTTSGLDDLRGLSGAHRKVVQEAAKSLGDPDA